MPKWHSLPWREVLAQFQSSEEGLSALDAQRRLSKYGRNQLEFDKEPFWKKLVAPFRSVFVAILAAAAAISWLAGENLDGAVIVAIIAVNTAIYYSQQHATGRVLRSLKKHTQQHVQVRRDGRSETISSQLLVPGDIIRLSEGQRVAADARIIDEQNLYVDESALTGESLPVEKHSQPIAEPKLLYGRSNMLFQGTYVISGSATAVVIATGRSTEFGNIARLATAEELKSPMQQKIDGIVSRLIKIIALVAALVFALSLLRGAPADEALRFVMALSVSVVPESLPIALSAVVVLGMRRMARKNALVRSMKAIEDIGLVTVIATDKTGTLTKNDLKVVEIWGKKIKGVDYKEICFKALGDSTNIVEPFDEALVEFAGRRLSSGDKLLSSYPFEQKFLMSGAAWQEAGSVKLYIKGAPEHLLAKAQPGHRLHATAESELRRLVSQGFRVIGLGRAQVGAPPEDLGQLKTDELEFLGFVAFADELRPESELAITQAHQAGITVKMITGDHYETAFHVGRQLGLGEHREQVILGGQLPTDETQLAATLKTKSIFARILPEQKFNLLKVLKKSEITAMTGDGVNDVPALSSAHVGIAMGSGSDIAKDAGDIILLDNNFASIVRAISEGRVIYDNIKKMLFYLLSTSLGEVLTMIGALLVGLPLPVSAIQILWINLVTDTALVIPLGLEPAEAGHMKKPPRPPKAPLLDRLILSRIAVVSATMAVVTLAVFALLTARGYSLAYAQTVAFMMLVVAQWANAFNARSERLSVFKRISVPNYKLLVGLSLAVGLQMMAILGPLAEFLDVQAVSAQHLLLGSAAIAGAVLAAGEIHKAIYRRRTPS